MASSSTLTLDVSAPVRPRVNCHHTVYVHSVSAPVKVQISFDGVNWVDVFTQGAAGNGVYTLAHVAQYVKVSAVSGSPTGNFYLVTGNY